MASLPRYRWRPRLRGLRLRLIAAFGLVIGISLFFAGLAAVWLLRDQQAAAAEQHIGRLVPTFSERVLQMELFGWPANRMRADLLTWADYFDVRILLLDQDGRVFVDTANGQPLIGETLDVTLPSASATPGADGASAAAVASGAIAASRERDDGPQPFRSMRRREHGEDLYLFTASRPLPVVPANVPLRQPQATLVLAVPATDVTSAWAQLLPRLLVAGGLAAAFAVVVGTVLSARITRPIDAMTRASQAMAQGDYQQRIDARGTDEVAALARAFNSMAAQVDRSSRAMRQLLANVSHELKTPLTSIQGYSQALLDGVASDPAEQRELVGVVHAEAERMRSLVDDLLYLSSIESGELRLALDEIDCDPLIAASVRRFAFQANERGVTVRPQTAAGTLRADGRRLEQVVANLLDNAIRFSPPGGEVLVRAYGDGPEVVLEVRNGGEPIPEEALPQIFDRFYQADPARAGARHSGLGLAIVRELVQAHGGHVVARSTREDGTTMTVRLPRRGPAGGEYARGAGEREPR